MTGVSDEVVKDNPVESNDGSTDSSNKNPTGNEAQSADAVAELEQPIDLFKDLMEQLNQAQAQAAEYLDGWQRARAEFANYKRRTEAERIELSATAGADVLARVLPAIDDFDRAANTLPDDLKDHAWINGVMLIYRKLLNTLDASNVKPIVVQPGDTFDPTIHEAITHEDSDQFSSGQIIAELQRGYKMGERVLRPAMVRVAK
jgi:molecular chaperone GrpE